jgi:hypothetical protein
MGACPRFAASATRRDLWGSTPALFGTRTQPFMGIHTHLFWVSLTACMRKLLVILNAIIRLNQPFNSELAQ